MRNDNRLCATFVVTALVLLLLGGPLRATSEDFLWHIPKPFPRPAVPADNPMTSAKVTLGRYLFYDTRMSVNGQESCATCHRQELAFTDGRKQAQGTTGQLHPRSSMSLANVAYSPVLTWANPSLTSLEDQALGPMLGTEPVELGLKGQENRFLTDLSRDAIYQHLFPEAFPEQASPYSIENVTKALAAFERTIISVNSPYDRYRYGDQPDAVSPAAKRGEVLFFSGERTGCFHCHGSWNFNAAVKYEGGPEPRAVFQNNGLSTLQDALSDPVKNMGLYQFTKRREDIGKFRAPTLRNIAVTAPYMHDGSIASLSEVIDHYASGGRDNPNKSLSIRGFKLSEGEKNDLIAFLNCLTDTEFLSNPNLSNPWKQ